MLPNEKEPLQEKTKLHLRNRHRQQYDFEILSTALPELSEFVALNKYNNQSVDFFNPKAVMSLNKALLKQYYDIEHWDIPENFLCPPIPGRADYIHYMADLLAGIEPGEADSKIALEDHIRCLDIGVGANCIYPIIGVKEYGWSFVGSDIDTTAIKSASEIVQQNKCLFNKVEIRHQQNSNDFFCGIVHPDETFDITICNPPFHASKEEAQEVATRKLRNLQQKNITTPTLNFGGQSNELWCYGGEERFIRTMIHQSAFYASSCLWFSTLISKQPNVEKALNALQKAKALETKVIRMGQGNKTSRIVAWTFLTKEEQAEWQKERQK